MKSQVSRAPSIALPGGIAASWLGGFALCALMFLAPSLMAQSNVTTNSLGVLTLLNSFGDLNDDGKLNSLDLVLLTHHLNGTRLLGPLRATRADVNGDGLINDTDRRILADLIAGRNTKPDEDFDGDELSNAEEIRRGTDPFDPDTDHDGSLDGWEVVEGTNPLNPQSRIPVTVLARPPVQVLFPLIQNTDTNAGGTVLARPPVLVILPAIAEEEVAGAITIARPSLQLIHPLLQESDTNLLGTVVARPPVKGVILAQ